MSEIGYPLAQLFIRRDAQGDEPMIGIPGTEYSGFGSSLAEAAKFARKHREAMLTK